MGNEWLSIYGLTRLYTGTGTIFDELQLPTQFTDPTVITDRLMLDTMELEVLYSDPDTFKGALGIYSKSRLPSWQKLADDMYHAYDPYINFTRDEARVNIITKNLEDLRTDNLQDKRTADLTEERTPDLSEERTYDLTDERTPDLSEERTLDLANGNTRTTSKNAWNGTGVGTMVAAEQIVDSGTDTGTDTLATTGTDTNTRTGTDTLATTGTDTRTTSGTDTYNKTGTQKNEQTGTLKTEDYFHSQGDSAMFTPTDIAKKEFELRAQYSVIEYILADIKTHFCLMVY